MYGFAMSAFLKSLFKIIGGTFMAKNKLGPKFKNKS
jgi:hypothetical protein